MLIKGGGVGSYVFVFFYVLKTYQTVHFTLTPLLNIHILNLTLFMYIVWVFLFWSLPVTLKFQTVAKDGSSSDRATSLQRLLTVTSAL